MSSDPPKAPEPGPWQLSLRELLIVVIVLGMGIVIYQTPRIILLVRKHQNQAHLDRLELTVGQVTFRRGDIISLSFSDHDGGKLDDQGLAKLSGFDKLEVLGLSRCSITDDGLTHLGALPTLQSLGLAFTEIGDAGMRHLVALRDLRYLDLSFTNVTDIGLEELQNLKTLTRLILGGTQVTEEGVSRLQQALPNCEISRY